MNQWSQKGRFSFSKEERISEKKIIDTLFNNCKNFNESPFDIRFLNQEIKDDSFSRVLITVSSSRIKSAVKRNLLKRRIKESYRKNKKIISNKSLMIAFVYVSDEILIYSDINDSVIKILKKLSKV
jgi:ribonuclease P protein component